jgi:hypothetical protein
MRRAVRIVGFAALTAGGTVLGGWWTVPLLAAAWVRVLPSGRRPVRTTAMGATLGWAILLAWNARYGPIATLATSVSAVLELPKWGFLAVTLAFPALLAGAAAMLLKPAPAR